MPSEIVQNLDNFEKKNTEIFSMLNQTNNEVENLEIATENKRDDIIALMKKIGKLKEEQNTIKAKEEEEAERQSQKIVQLENNISDCSGTMERLQKVTISMYRFLLDRTLTEDREEATFRENLDFEIIPIQKYLAWVEDIAEKICIYSQNAYSKLPRRGPLYEIVEGISQDSMTKAEKL